MTRSFEEVVDEAERTEIAGWDFSWLDGRAFEERPSWHYFDVVASKARNVSSMLDLETGSGQMIAALPVVPALTVGTEGYAPNVARATTRLRSRGAHLVVPDSNGRPLPFRGDTFALVTSRHPVTTWWDEIARVLRPGGSYLSQQVGPDSLRELSELLMGAAHPRDRIATRNGPSPLRSGPASPSRHCRPSDRARSSPTSEASCTSSVTGIDEIGSGVARRDARLAPVTPPRMHDDEVETDADLVRSLLVSQHPQWAELPITRVASAGTDNAMYRLGDDLAVRLPRIDWAVGNIAKERKWLPILAPHLPLAVPLPVAIGEPDPRFPYPWSVVRWLPGELATVDRLADPVQAALDLAAFVRALRTVDATDGPRHHRGLPVRLLDQQVRDTITNLRGEVDADAVTDAWDRVMRARDYDGPAMWFHGDLAYLNLLAQDGKLTAVIDWGTCGVGDPAIETSIAWSLFPPEARRAYRDALEIDDDTWERGKGWVLSGVFGIPYYRDTNPVLVADKVTAIEAVLADAL